MSCGSACGCDKNAQPQQSEETVQTEERQDVECCREDGQCACKQAEEEQPIV